MSVDVHGRGQLGVTKPPLDLHRRLPGLCREDRPRELVEGVKPIRWWSSSISRYSEIRDLDDRIVAIGHMRGRGTKSGAEIESPWAYVVEFNNGKATRVRAYLDPKEALEAVGLRE